MPPPLVLEAVELKKVVTVFKNELRCQCNSNICSKPLVKTIQRKNHGYFVNNISKLCKSSFSHVNPSFNFPTDQPPSPGGKNAYASGTTTKITSVSTGNLCTEVRSGKQNVGY